LTATAGVAYFGDRSSERRELEMSGTGVKMPDMAKKRKPGRPATGRRPTYLVYARIDPALGAAFDQYLEKTRPKPTTTAAVELALERLLTEAGYWPPPGPAAGE
jgi:hypothetical protein